MTHKRHKDKELLDSVQRRKNIIKKMTKRQLLPLTATTKCFFAWLYGARVLLIISLVFLAFCAFNASLWGQPEGMGYIWFASGIAFLYMSTARGLCGLFSLLKIGIEPSDSYASDFVERAAKFQPDVKRAVSGWLEKSDGVISAQDMHFALIMESKYQEEIGLARMLYFLEQTRKEYRLWSFLSYQYEPKRRSFSELAKNQRHLLEVLEGKDGIKDFIRECDIKRSRRILQNSLQNNDKNDSLSEEKTSSRPVNRM